MPPTDTSVKPTGVRRGRWVVVLAAFAALAWSLPRPLLHDVVVDYASDSTTPPRGRLAFRTAELLSDFSGKGSLADETELSGPCFANAGRTLFFARSRPGQRADIVRSTFDGERWTKPESVRELNSVDDDRRLTMSGDGRIAALASNRSGGHGGFDLYESTHDGHRWSRPRNAGASINTDADEFDPALSPDGLTLFFVRVVSGAGAELFVTRREALDAEWSSPETVAAINSPTSHERSPAVSPDGSWLLFSSNRGSRPGEPAPFALFRASLRDGHVGDAERLRDGIASDADDLDAAFSSDGRSIAFASKRDGPKQLFLSRGEFVVTRLTISTAHLERFGRAKWGVPFVGALLFAGAWHWSRKVRVVPTTVATPTPAVVVAVPPRRSEPPKNPLANWTSTEPTAPLPTAKKANPLLASASLLGSATETPADETPKKPMPREENTTRPIRRRVAVALLVVAASLAIAFRFHVWTGTEHSTDAPVVGDAHGLAVIDFADVVPTRPIELPQLDRINTARAVAPQPVPVPSDTVALRPAARWPNDRVVVRSRSEVVRVADVEPPASKQTRFVTLVRRSVPTELTRATVRPAEDLSLTAVARVNETPHAVAPINTMKQMFDPSASERTSVHSATSNRASLPRPSVRVGEFAQPPLPSASAGPDVSHSLARRGPSSRVSQPIGLTDLQALTGLAPVASLESSLPQPSFVVPRAEAPMVGQPSVTSAITIRSLLPVKTSTSLVVGATAEPLSSGSPSARLPAKSPIAVKVSPLTEDVVRPTKEASTEASQAPAAVSPSRIESQGPQPSLPITAPLATTASRNELAMLRSPNRIDVATSTDVLAQVAPNPSWLVQRVSRLPVIATVAADSAGSPMPGGPAILLASATMLVELLASPSLTPLPRAESAGPNPSVAADSPSSLARWFSRTMMPIMRERQSPLVAPHSSIPMPTLPRRERLIVPVELRENLE